MTKRLAIVLVVMIVGTACGISPASGLDQAQPTLLTPPADETPVLHPPDADPVTRGEAFLVIHVERGEFDSEWRELHAIAERYGGWVSSVYTGTGGNRGESYEFGTAILELPQYSFSEAVDRVQELGSRISSTATLLSPTETFTRLSVTLTESDTAFYAGFDPAPEGRVDRALDTAGDVLVTILSVLIVAGAVVAPVVVLSLIGYWVWRSVRRRYPLVEGGVEQPREEEIEPVEG